MAAELATGYISLVPSASGFRNAIQSELGPDLTRAGSDAGDSAAKGFGTRFSSGIKTAGRLAAVGFGALFAGAFVIGKQSIDAASNLQEAQGKVNVVFGEGAGAISDWAGTAADAFGTSQRQALESAGTFGNLFTAFGIGTEPAGAMSTSLVELAADMASFNNVPVEDALAALQSGLTGETEPLKRFGVAMDDAALKTEAVRLGLIATTSDALTPAAKAQAAYSLIMAATTNAQGDFARTSDGLANSQKTMSAKLEDTKAVLGQALLPVMIKVVEAATNIVDTIKAKWPEIMATARPIIDFLVEGFRKVIDFVTGLGTGPVLAALGAFVVAIIAVNVAMLANPAVLIAAGIAALVAGVIYAYQNFEQFRVVVDQVATYLTTTFFSAVEYVKAFWRTFGDEIESVVRSKFEMVKDLIQAAMDVIQGVIKVVTGLIHGDWSQVWEGIKQIFTGVWDGIKAYVIDALNTIKALLSAAWTVIKGAVGVAWDGIKSAISGAWDGITSAVSTGIGNVVDLISGLPGKAVGALSSLGSLLAGAVKTAMFAVAGAMGDLVRNAVDIAKGLPGKMVDALSGLASSVSSAVTSGLRSAVNSAVDTINRAIPNDIPLGSFFGQSISIPLPDNPFPRLHSGGYVPGSPGTEVPAILQAGEFVMSRAMLAGGGGGITVNNNRRDFTANDMAQTIQIARLQMA